MGLSLQVGLLADLLKNDPEGAEEFKEYFTAVNVLLRKFRLEPHEEPNDCEEWSCDMYGYSGLHYLRRIALHIDAKGQCPSPGTKSNSTDPLDSLYNEEFINRISQEKPGFLASLFKKKNIFSSKFDHLLMHSDAEGFYLPQDFDQVLIDSELGIPGQIVGSAPRLLAELDRIAAILEIPSHLNSQSEALWDAGGTQNEGAVKWERYSVESFSCVVLREGCRQCIKTGAALVFC